MRFVYLSTLLIILSIGGCKINDNGERGPAGGWVFYEKGDWSGDWMFWEAAPEDLSIAPPWRTHDVTQPWGTGATQTGVGTGDSNTSKIVSTYGL